MEGAAAFVAAAVAADADLVVLEDGRAEGMLVLVARVEVGLVVLVVQEGGPAAVEAAVDLAAALRGVAAEAAARAGRRFIPRMPHLAADSTAARPIRSPTVIDPLITADGITATGTAAGATLGAIGREVGIGGAVGA